MIENQAVSGPEAAGAFSLAGAAAPAATSTAILQHMTELDQRLRAHEDRIGHLERELGAAAHGQATLPPASNLVETIGRIVELSRELFPGPVSIRHSFDPENPADQWLVFDVVAKGEYKDYREREFRWHEEVEKTVPDARFGFRLSVMPQR